MNLQTIARALGGEVCGRQVLAPGPGHSRQDRSLSIRLDPRAPGGFRVHSFSGDNWRTCRDHVRDRVGLAQEPGILHHEAHDPSPLADTAARTADALWLWGEARDPRGTRAEAYLQHRGLTLPEETAGTAIRYDAAHSFAGGRTSAMLALVRDIHTNKPQAIHRTALSWGATKWTVNGKDRLARGPIRGAAVKLTPDEDVTTCLGIGEGIESTLSLRLVPEFGPSPVWALLTAGGVERFPVLSGIECLWIAVDHDTNGAGQTAARTCAERWHAAGREVHLITPKTEGADLNDLARRCRHA
jgi:putative DNA primase/helicase